MPVCKLQNEPGAIHLPTLLGAKRLGPKNWIISPDQKMFNEKELKFRRDILQTPFFCLPPLY